MPSDLSDTYPSQGFKPQIVPLHSLYLMTPRKSSVPVHDKGYMLRYWSLPERTYKEFAQL